MSFAKVSLRVEDRTQTSTLRPIGVAALAIQTQRGPIGEANYLRSFQEYREIYGEIVDTGDILGPVYAKRVFDAGGQIYVSRIVHFSDINDINSATPLAATGDNSGTFNFAQNIVALDAGADTLTIAGDFTDYVTAGDTHTVQLAGGGTSALTVDAAGATYAGGFTTIAYVALAGTESVNDSLTWSVTLTATLTYTASSIGSWGNDLQVRITRAASGLANALDIYVTSTDAQVIGTDLNEVYSNFPATPTQADIDNFNAQMNLLSLTLSGVTAPIGVVPNNALTGGTDDYASVTEIDYIGSTVANNGLRAFDAEVDFVRIAAPELASNVLDNALLNYANLRKDCLAILRTPESLTAAAAIDYRNAAGAYTGGTKIDDWRAVMLYGGIKVTSPYAGDNGAEITISWIADYLGKSAVKDRERGAWFSVSGIDAGRGILSNVNDIVYNINTPSRSQEREDLTNAGLFPIVKDTYNGEKVIVSWGDTTLQVTPSFLQKENVANLVIYINNQINPIAKGQLFNPNDVGTWKSIYRQVIRVMRAIQDGGGIENFRYEGDQDVDFASQAVINTPATVAQGIYKFNLFFTPISSLNEVQGVLVVSASGTIVEAVQ